MKDQTESEVPADEVDDGFVVDVGVCCAGTSSFICQLQNMIFVWEFPAHLTAAHRSLCILNAHSYNKQYSHSQYKRTAQNLIYLR